MKWYENEKIIAAWDFSKKVFGIETMIGWWIGKSIFSHQYDNKVMECSPRIIKKSVYDYISDLPSSLFT